MSCCTLARRWQACTPSGDAVFIARHVGQTILYFLPPRAKSLSQLAALGSSIATALVGGLITGEHKK